MPDEKFEILNETVLKEDAQENYHALPAGEVLRRVRMQNGLTLQQVEADIRIVANYLDALEKSDFEKLPAQVYIVGFVKTYSDYLNLDAAKMVQLLKKQTGNKVRQPANIFPVASEDQKIPSLKVVAASTAVLVLILLAWNFNRPGDRADDIPAVPKELARQMTAPQKPAAAVAAASPQAVPVAQPKPHPVVLKAVQNVWLEIRDANGQPIFSRVLKQGEEYWVPPEAMGYKMTTGNAGGLQMVVEGVPLSALGRAGEVKRNISLNSGDLKALLPQIPSAAPQSN